MIAILSVINACIVYYFYITTKRFELSKHFKKVFKI